MINSGNEEMWEDFPEVPTFPEKPWTITSTNKKGDRITIGCFHTRGEAVQQIARLSRCIPDLTFSLKKTHATQTSCLYSQISTPGHT